jgi:hypothetical protein
VRQGIRPEPLQTVLRLAAAQAVARRVQGNQQVIDVSRMRLCERIV